MDRLVFPYLWHLQAVGGKSSFVQKPLLSSSLSFCSEVTTNTQITPRQQMGKEDSSSSSISVVVCVCDGRCCFHYGLDDAESEMCECERGGGSYCCPSWVGV
eukprot:TRINITY_DN9874_c0_g1_i2.p1 TRINITY_DN9874_c0_g1~~TRINITY_DN9874_c0_g1_i2.p1  ORF type:complete len:102 (+),score=2.27 TRINITY_DN9874_c0_g1_i2:786-1091(+)